MAHQASCKPSPLKLFLVLMGFCLAGYIVGRPLYWHFAEGLAAFRHSCPSCVCDCASEALLSLPAELSNTSLPGFFLNPRFHYPEGFVYTDHIRSGVTKVIERLAPDVTFAIKATRVLAQFRGKIGRFGDLTTKTAVGIMNPDCGKHDSEENEELERNFMDLLAEELKLQEAGALENQQRAEMALLEAKKMASQYQKEADKCNAGIETCEEARERSEAALRDQKKFSVIWEARARQRGWKERSHSQS